MLDLYRIIRGELIVEPSITAYVKERVYMSFPSSGKFHLNFPFITIHISDGSTDSLTNDYRPSLEIHIWTKGNANQTQAEEIAKNILLRIDKKSYLNESPCIFQLWKVNGVGVFDDSSQTFHKILSFNVVMEGYGA